MKIFILSFLMMSLYGVSSKPYAANYDKFQILKEEYRINGYKKTFNGGLEKVPLKIRVTQPSFGKEKIEVISYHTGYGWTDVTFCMVNSTNETIDGREIANSFDYKASCAGTVYFNF